MRIWNGVRNTLRPCVNSMVIRGNKDLPCVHMGGRVTLYLDVKLRVNVLGTTRLVTGSRVTRLLANEMSVLAL